jgi:hypothetical protein
MAGDKTWQYPGTARVTVRPCAINSTQQAVKITFFMQRDELKKNLIFDRFFAY